MQQFIDDYPEDCSATPPVLVIAGGVAVKNIYAACRHRGKNGFRLSVPPAALCTDTP